MLYRRLVAERPNSNTSGRHGNMLWVMLAAICAILVFLGAMLWRTTVEEVAAEQRPLVMHTAAGTRAAIEAIVADYEQEYGVEVELQFGGSNTLLNQIQINKFDTADLYLAADDFYTSKAVDLGLAREVLPAAYQRPVIALPKESKLNVTSIRDLLDGQVTISMANPEQAAVGKAIKRALEQIPDGDSNLWEKLSAQVTDKGVFKPTVNEVANDVKIGAVDAGLVWDSTGAMPNYRDSLRVIPVAELDGDPNLVCISVLSSSEQPAAALRFARYLTARDRGLKHFESFGMKPVEGDVWAEKPEINFFCGAVNRRSIEPILEEFQEREGVVINTIYDGCGILTSRMETIDDQRPEKGFPDIYMACDRYYLDNVASWFENDVDVSETELVIVVPKGSTRVKTLADLVEPGVRVAIGEPTQCTIGALTRRLLQQENLYDELKEKQRDRGEVIAEKASSALIVPDVTTGHVDAAIAYLTDVQQSLDKVDVIRIESQLNKAVQPFSIARTSQHKELGRRLLAHISRSRKMFEAAGFTFRIQDAAGATQVESEPGS